MAGVPPRHGAAARAGALGRLHHDADQRPQDLRHRPCDRARLGPGRRERDRPRHVEDFVRRRQRLRPRVGDRGVPVRARDPGPRPQHPPVQEGGLAMATAAAERRPEPVVVAEGLSPKILRMLGKAPVQIFLVVVGVLWLVPTFGLLITSFMTPADFSETGWWKMLSAPSKLTWDNYQNLFSGSLIDIKSA